MNALKAIAFDLYGTLFDVHTVAARCEATFPGKGQALSIEWRRKQLEYTWLRTLMKRYVPFEDATRDALRYVCRSMQLPLDDEACNRLCDAYLHLHAYPEVPAALGALKATGVPLAILSNGSPMTIRAVTSNAGLDPLFDHLLSVDAVQAFKPHEHAYGLAEKAFGVGRESILFVSSNAWDATGAKNFGFTTAWINRHDLPFEELGESPDWQVRGLDELAVRFRQALAD